MGKELTVNQFTNSPLRHHASSGSIWLFLTMAEKRRLIQVSTWAGHLAADVSYRSAVDVARQLSVSLLTVSHSVSKSGVLNLFPARNQFAPFLALVHRPLPDCCFTPFVDETSKPSDLCIVCCGVSYYCYHSCSFSAIDHRSKPRQCSKLEFRA